MPDRRSALRWLATGIAALTAGCVTSTVDTTSGRGATDVVLHSEASDSTAVAVTVTEADAAEPAIDDEVELAPTERHTIDNEVLMQADYEVAIDVADGASETHTWEDAGQPLHVVVDDSRNVLFAVQVG